MTLNYAILGFLNWQPLSGYDLKKLFADSAFIYWSGNNNQIYRTLLELHRQGLVASEMIVQDSGPARKVYTITPAGQAELRAWLSSPPEPPQFRNTFLIQLAWADLLEAAEIAALLESYAHELEMQLLMAREHKKRKPINPARSPREALLWEMIEENRIRFYANELDWVHQLQAELHR